MKISDRLQKILLDIRTVIGCIIRAVKTLSPRCENRAGLRQGGDASDFVSAPASSFWARSEKTGKILLRQQTSG